MIALGLFRKEANVSATFQYKEASVDDSYRHRTRATVLAHEETQSNVESEAP